MSIRTLLSLLFIDKTILEARSFIQQNPIFHNLTNAEIGRIFRIMYKKIYQPGEIIFEEGNMGKAVFFIYSGSVEIVKKECSVTVTKGNVVGETVFLEEAPRIATARTLERTEMYLIYKAHFDNFIQRNPRIGLKIIRNIAHFVLSQLRTYVDQAKQK